MIILRNADTGVSVPAETDQYKQLIMLIQGGRLQRAAEAGRLFCVSNQAAVTTTASVQGTWTGLGISNPLGSGKNIIMHQFGWGLSIKGSDEGVVGLATCSIAVPVAAIAARSCFFGAGISIAYCDDGATVVSPIIERICGTYGTGDINTAMLYAPTTINLDGGLILAPGRSVVTDTTTVTTSGFIFSFVWEEISE